MAIENKFITTDLRNRIQTLFENYKQDGRMPRGEGDKFLADVNLLLQPQYVGFSSYTSLYNCINQWNEERIVTKDEDKGQAAKRQRELNIQGQDDKSPYKKEMKSNNEISLLNYSKDIEAPKYLKTIDIKRKIEDLDSLEEKIRLQKEVLKFQQAEVLASLEEYEKLLETCTKESKNYLQGKIQQLEEMANSSKVSVVLKTGDTEFHTTADVLRRYAVNGANFFTKALEGDWAESKTRVFDFPDISAMAIREVLFYLDTGILRDDMMKESLLIEVLNLIDRWQIMKPPFQVGSAWRWSSKANEISDRLRFVTPSTLVRKVVDTGKYDSGVIAENYCPRHQINLPEFKLKVVHLGVMDATENYSGVVAGYIRRQDFDPQVIPNNAKYLVKIGSKVCTYLAKKVFLPKIRIAELSPDATFKFFFRSVPHSNKYSINLDIDSITLNDLYTVEETELPDLVPVLYVGRCDGILVQIDDSAIPTD